MELPEITAETIRLVAEHWGSERGDLRIYPGNRAA